MDESDMFHDLRVEYDQQKMCELVGIAGILKKEPSSAAPNSQKVRFNDSGNTEVIFDPQPAYRESMSPRFDNEAKYEVISDYHSERHESKSHRVNYSGQADSELIYDYRQNMSEPPVQNLNQSGIDSTKAITEDSCKERHLDSGCSS